MTNDQIELKINILETQRSNHKSTAWATGIIGIVCWPLWIATIIFADKASKVTREIMELQLDAADDGSAAVPAAPVADVRQLG